MTINGLDGKTVWDHTGTDSAFHSVLIHVGQDGALTTSDDQDIYITPGAIVTQGNMRQYTRDPETFDTLWPGIYPDTYNKLAVNVKLDMFPKVIFTMAFMGRVLASVAWALSYILHPPTAGIALGNKLGVSAA